MIVIFLRCGSVIVSDLCSVVMWHNQYHISFIYKELIQFIGLWSSPRKHHSIKIFKCTITAPIVLMMLSLVCCCHTCGIVKLAQHCFRQWLDTLLWPAIAPLNAYLISFIFLYNFCLSTFFPFGWMIHLWYFLKHSGQDKMVTIWQTTFSNNFSSMKMFRFL